MQPLAQQADYYKYGIDPSSVIPDFTTHGQSEAHIPSDIEHVAEHGNSEEHRRNPLAFMRGGTVSGYSPLVSINEDMKTDFLSAVEKLRKGDKMPWAGGVLLKNEDDSVTYQDPNAVNGGMTFDSRAFDNPNSVQLMMEQAPAVAKQWKAQYDVEPGTNENDQRYWDAQLKMTSPANHPEWFGPGPLTPEQEAGQRAIFGGKLASEIMHSARGGRVAPSAASLLFTEGGVPHKGSHYVQGDGGGQDDLIDARLADGEYVFDADVVAALGDGSNKEGARKLDEMRAAIREHKRSAPVGKIPPKAKSPLAYLKGLK